MVEKAIDPPRNAKKAKKHDNASVGTTGGNVGPSNTSLWFLIGAGVIMVLHDPALAHRFCDRALLVYGDGQTRLGPVDDILTAATLSELYGYGLRQIEDRGHRCFIPE